MAELKSRHAFGSEANVDTAIEQGVIDAYDVLFLDEGKIGWIDKNGNKVIPDGKKYVAPVDALPEAGDDSVIYIYNGKFYYWDGVQFVTGSTDGGVDEATVDAKVAAAKDAAIESANLYTDEKFASATVSVVEF